MPTDQLACKCDRLDSAAHRAFTGISFHDGIDGELMRVASPATGLQIRAARHVAKLRGCDVLPAAEYFVVTSAGVEFKLVRTPQESR